MKDKFMIIAGIGFGIVIIALVVVLVLTITTDIFKPTSSLTRIPEVKNNTTIARSRFIVFLW